MFDLTRLRVPSYDVELVGGLSPEDNDVGCVARPQ